MTGLLGFSLHSVKVMDGREALDVGEGRALLLILVRLDLHVLLFLSVSPGVSADKDRWRSPSWGT